MSGWRPHRVEVHVHSWVLRCCEVRAPIDPLMKKVYSGSLSVSRYPLWWSQLNRPSLPSPMHTSLDLPRVPLTVLIRWVQIIQVLCSVGLLLSARRSLPLLELLVNDTLRVVDRHHGFAL